MNIKWLKRIIPKVLIVGVILGLLIIPLIPIPVFAANNTWIQHDGGGTGVWSDTGHWSLGHVPDATESAIFDVNSFNGAGQTVTVDAGAFCLDMDWTGATNIPTFVLNAATLQAYGNVTFIADMITSGTNILYLDGVGTNTLTTNGLTLSFIVARNGTGITSLADNLTVSTGIRHMKTGEFITNNNNIDTPYFDVRGVTNILLTLGSSTITTSGWFTDGAGTLTLTAHSSTIIVTGIGAFQGKDKTYYNVELNGTAHTVSGSNTFTKLSFKPAGAQAITFTDGTTQTAASFERTGTGQITFQGSGVGGWAITDTGGGTNTFNALTISRSTASPVNTFYATTSSLDSGNNVAWTFPGTVTTSAMTSVDSADATANATTVDQGGSAIIARGFCYNTTGTPTTADTTVVVAGTLGTYSGNIPNGDDVKHYVRPYFTNATSTYYGSEVSYIIPANTGEYMLRSLLRVLTAALILVGVLRMSGKGGTSLMVLATIGILAFAIINTLIDLAL